MSEPFIGEIRPMGFGFPPKGWAECNGQLLQINQNQALFSLLGTTYGGDGRTTFALPDLRGRVPIAWGTTFPVGASGGEEQVTLGTSQLPTHAHNFQASTQNANVANPTGAVLGASNNLYGAPQSLTPVGVSAPYGPMIAPAGAAGAHENRMPFTVINFCIALVGIYPSRN
jgi:microcystin-dependent protein